MTPRRQEDSQRRLRRPPPHAAALHVCALEAALPAIGAALRFSPRTLDIIRCMLREEPDTAIAATLGMSYNTVRTHISRVYLSTGVRSRAGLMVRLADEMVRQMQMRERPAENDHPGTASHARAAMKSRSCTRRTTG